MRVISQNRNIAEYFPNTRIVSYRFPLTWGVAGDIEMRSSNLLSMPQYRGRPAFPIESRIVFLRHRRVILDADLAELYGVPVRQLNQQVKRNRGRFPADFILQLTAKEHKILRSQFVISSLTHGGRRYLPQAFTEHGAIMAATVLNSDRAVRMSVFVVRAFVHLREMLATNWKLAHKIEELETRLDTHDDVLREILDAIKELATPPKRARRKIGFQLPTEIGVGPTGTRKALPV